MYGEQEEQSAILSDLYTKSEQLYASNPTEFDSASLRLIHLSWSELREDDRIRLECVNIWHKSGLDCYLFRIRFYLNLSPDSDEALLKRSIIQAYTEKADSVVAQYDCKVYYDRLFYSLFTTDDPHETRLKAALRRIDSEALATDVDGVLTFVQIHALPGMRTGIPPYMKVIWTAVTNLSVIAGDGLSQWISDHKEKDCVSLKNACKKIGLTDTAKVLEKLHLLVYGKETPENTREEMIDALETALLSSFDDRMLMSSAEEYRATSSAKRR